MLRLMDLEMPTNTLVIMIKRGNGFFVPTGKTIVLLDDILLVITDNRETLEALCRKLNVKCV